MPEPREYFKVLYRLSLSEVPKHLLRTAHVVDSEHYRRLRVYGSLLSTKYIYAFLVNTGHRDGLEIHAINKNGLIYIFNSSSKRLITVVHPRAEQLFRYFTQCGMKLTKKLLALAEQLDERNRIYNYNNL